MLSPKKDPRLERIEEDFKKVQSIFRLEPKIRKTKNIESLIRAVKLSVSYMYGAVENCCTLYRLKKNRYPDTEIINILRKKIEETRKLLPAGKNLFSN